MRMPLVVHHQEGGYLWLCQPCDQITLDIPVHTEFGIPVLSSISHHHHLVCWVHATDEMVVLVYAVIRCTWNQTLNLWNPGTGTSTATCTPPRSDARLQVSMESLCLRGIYNVKSSGNWGDTGMTRQL